MNALLDRLPKNRPSKDVEEGQPAISEIPGTTGSAVARLVAILLIALCICAASAALVFGILWRSLSSKAVSTAMVS